MKKIAVYCGATKGNQIIYQKATQKLGLWIASRNMDLVYGGARVGLMGLLAKTVLKEGRKVYGIMPKEIYKRGVASKKLTSLTIVNDISLRKKKMISMADVCLALPGGIGTLEEIIDAYSWATIGDNDKPCIFFNINNYYDPLKRMFKKMVENDFLAKNTKKKLLFSNSLSEIKTFIKTYVPPKLRKYKN